MEHSQKTDVVVALISRARESGAIEYLLVQSKKDFGEFTGCWYPPGGHMEIGEDETTALVREIQEELGVYIEPVNKIAQTPGDIENQITHWWMCKLITNTIILDTDELSGVGWFTKKDMDTMSLWPATQKCFETYIFTQAEI